VDRKHAYCRTCARAYNRKYWLDNPDKHEARKKQQRQQGRHKRIERKMYTREWQQKQRERLRAYKETLRCVRCGFDHPAALDFHHRDPAEKKFGVAQGALKYAWSTLLAEIAKCDVLCSNCHRIEHDPVVASRKY
jgi:hypothetical protein